MQYSQLGYCECIQDGLSHSLQWFYSSIVEMDFGIASYHHAKWNHSLELCVEYQLWLVHYVGQECMLASCAAFACVCSTAKLDNSCTLATN